MNNKILLSAAVLGTLAFQTFAQPRMQWIRTYGDNNDQGFRDLYNTTDDSYLMCGNNGEQVYVVKVDEDGGEIWSIIFGQVGITQFCESIIELDGGEIITGGYSDGYVLVIRISSEGEIVWSRTYGRNFCRAIIELKEGDLMLAGVFWEAGVRYGLLMRLNAEDGDVVWSRSYNDHAVQEFCALRETDGGVLVAGTSNFQDENRNYVTTMLSAKIEFDSNPIWWETYEPHRNFQAPREYALTMTSHPQGFVMAGRLADSRTRYQQFATRMIGADGQESWYSTTDFDWQTTKMEWAGICRLQNGDLIQVGYCGGDFELFPTIQWLSADGQENWHAIYDMTELGEFGQRRNRFASVIPTADGGVLACGTVWNNANSSFDGFIMKLEPLVNGPVIYFRSPSDTSITVLIDDTLRFTVGVRDPLDREITYLWVRNERDSLSTDSTTLVNFPEIRIDSITCAITVGELTAAATWHVTVTDLYISAYTPDTLSLAVRRGTSVDFCLDTVRAVPGAPIDYLWLQQNLDDPGEVDSLGEDAQVTVEFLQSGRYRVDGTALRGESSDVITWDVTVRGAIWAFAPEELAFEVTPDSVVQFIVEPTVPDAEGQSIRWLVDGEVVAEDTTALAWSFSRADLNPPYLTQVQVVVADTVESDTVTWEVTVVDPDFVDDNKAGQAGTPVLLSVSPNPFNSTLTIAFSLPGFGEAGLRIYDIHGRIAADLHSKIQNPKSKIQKVIWDASSVPAGVYFVRLQSGSEVATKKVVLMR